MKAILWGYKYDNMRVGWFKQLGWVVKALQASGVDVVRHKKLQCNGLDSLPIWNPATDKCDICIYNHADISHLTGDILQVKQNWFFKPTVPDEVHTTLDELGFGPFSSITYKKPDYESVPDADVKQFFDTQVAGWIKNKDTKWGASFKGVDAVVPYEDYYLVLGQCAGDEVVTRHDFGSYVTKLEQVVRELARVDTTRFIVVKLHPYMDGEHAKDNKFSTSIQMKLAAINPRVKVFMGKSNVHAFLRGARCVILANSGAGFEVQMHGKPIIAWGYPEYHHIAYDLRHLASLIQAIKLDWFDVKKQNKFLCWYMERYAFYNQTTADRRVKELLDNAKSV